MVEPGITRVLPRIGHRGRFPDGYVRGTDRGQVVQVETGDAYLSKVGKVYPLADRVLPGYPMDRPRSPWSMGLCRRGFIAEQYVHCRATDVYHLAYPIRIPQNQG